MGLLFKLVTLNNCIKKIKNKCTNILSNNNNNTSNNDDRIIFFDTPYYYN